MLNPYLFYNGNCEAAFKFYEKVLGGKIEFMMRADEAPADMKPEPGFEKKIMHARMTIGSQILMASDAPPGHFRAPQGFAVSLTVTDLAEAEKTYKALAEGGAETMPFSKTFFSKGFGMCVDQFGTPWMVNCPLEGMG
jgi:PhnB protein